MTVEQSTALYSAEISTEILRLLDLIYYETFITSSNENPVEIIQRTRYMR